MTLLLQQLFDTPQTQEALWIGTLVAAMSAAWGYFVVLRGQSFLGHVLTDIGVSGASGAFLLGVNQWYGFVLFGLASGEAVEAWGDKAQDRDMTTGIILSFAMGLGALFLYLDARLTGQTSASQLILFGSLFTINPGTALPIVLTSLLTLVLIIWLYRPLLLISVNSQGALAKGVKVKFISLLYVAALAITVENTALIIGALMSTALLIGPAYTALQWTRRPGRGLMLSVLLGVIVMWLSIVLSYISAAWPPVGRGWPASFFIAAFSVIPAAMTAMLKSESGRNRISGLKAKQANRQTEGGLR